MDDGDLGLMVLGTQSEMKMSVFSLVYGNFPPQNSTMFKLMGRDKTDERHHIEFLIGSGLQSRHLALKKMCK